ASGLADIIALSRGTLPHRSVVHDRLLRGSGVVQFVGVVHIIPTPGSRASGAVAPLPVGSAPSGADAPQRRAGSPPRPAPSSFRLGPAAPPPRKLAPRLAA